MTSSEYKTRKERRADAMRGIMGWLKSCPAWPETKKDGAE